MNTNIQNEAILRLIRSESNNQFSFWPGLLKDQVVNLNLSLINDYTNWSKTFYYEGNSKFYLFFQLQQLDWDTTHFGYRCGAIKNFYIDDELTFLELDEISACIKQIFFQYLTDINFKFISADINSLSKNGNYFLQSLGFHFILNWIDGFWCSKSDIKVEKSISISELREQDLENACNLALKSYYKGGRFYADKRFDVSKVDSLYESVVRNSFQKGDIVLVLYEKTVPIGLFVIRKIKEYEKFNNIKVAHLRFLVIDENYRGKNAGFNFFNSTLGYLRDKCDLVVTGLESHNLASLNLHIKLGFKFNFSHNSYHLWLTK